MFIFIRALCTRFHFIHYTKMSFSENDYQYTKEGFTLDCKSSARLDVWENYLQQHLHMKAAPLCETIRPMKSHFTENVSQQSLHKNGFFIRVSTNMFHKICFPRKWLCTYSTCEWFLICVSTNMSRKIRFIRKGLRTYCTCEWLFICVNTNMSSKMWFIRKWLRTYCTYEWFFICVSTNMLREMWFMRKWLRT